MALISHLLGVIVTVILLQQYYNTKIMGVLMKGTPSRTQLGGIARTHLIQSDNQNKGGFIYKPKQIRL